MLVISEPPNHFSKLEWKELIQATFADDLLEYRTLKWMIGVDGWVEDIVLKLRQPEAIADNTPLDLLSHPLTRDRLALLHMAMFGSSMGMTIETIAPDPDPEALARIPNLQISGKELLDWATDKGLGWQTLSAPAYDAIHWLDDDAIGTRQVTRSSDQTLVLLTFPKADVVTARRTGSLPNALKMAFREFAVSADVIIGGSWSDEQVAVLGRSRQVPLSDFSPLRSETFELLAAQTTRELSQSYERNHLFAGKLSTGEYENRDWAPIYLSPSLVNTELGALLNITDQMLKSWSQAGEVEYLYFDYLQKPTEFPFNNTSLSEVVFDETGSQEVLFNWNTTGMSAVISGSPSIIVPTQTGSLPITYGSELEAGGKVETGHLQRHEEEAYEYFADLEDPNLSTIAQYTLLYQLLVAAVPPALDVLPTQATAGYPALADYAFQFLNTLSSTRNPAVNGTDLIAQFRSQYPTLGNRQLANMLADPRANSAFFEEVNDYRRRVADFNATITDFQAEIDQYNADIASLQTEIDQYNADVNRLNSEGGTPNQYASLDQRLAALDAKQQDFNRRASALDQRRADIERLQQQLEGLEGAFAHNNNLTRQIHELGRQLNPLVDRDDMDPIRIAFSNAYPVALDSWVKTPSSVLSWHNDDGRISLLSVGGHSVDSGALQLQELPNATTIQIVETANGPVLQYPPSARDQVLSYATRFPRLVEHRGIDNSQQLSQIIGPPIAPRSRPIALDVDRPIDVPPRSNRPPIDPELLQEIDTHLQANGDDFFVLGLQGGIPEVVSPNPKPPPSILRDIFGDTPTLHNTLWGRLQSSDGRLLWLGDPEQGAALISSLRTQRTGDSLQPPQTTSPIDRFKSGANLINRLVRQVTESSTQSFAVFRNAFSDRPALEITVRNQDGSLPSIPQQWAAIQNPLRLTPDKVQAGISLDSDRISLPPRLQEFADRGQLAGVRLVDIEVGTLGRTDTVQILKRVDDRMRVPIEQDIMENATQTVVESWGNTPPSLLDGLEEIEAEIWQQLGEQSPEQLDVILERGNDLFPTNRPQHHRPQTNQHS